MYDVIKLKILYPKLSPCQKCLYSKMSILQASPLIPPSRPEIIQSLIDGVDRYNPDNISILEEYLGAQLQNEEYDLMANLAILKL